MNNTPTTQAARAWELLHPGEEVPDIRIVAWECETELFVLVQPDYAYNGKTWRYETYEDGCGQQGCAQRHDAAITAFLVWKEGE